MDSPRTLPLFDPAARPQSWNERMAPGEFAVLYSGAVAGGPDVNTCAIFPSLPEAEEFAQRQAELYPTLRCRIYDHDGLGAAPLREVRGAKFKGEREMSTRMRRWVGSVFLFGGVVLFLIDWHANYELLWPAILGARMIPVGLFLLAVELVLAVRARRQAKR
jgi:hypothetical protein